MDNIVLNQVFPESECKKIIDSKGEFIESSNEQLLHHINHDDERYNIIPDESNYTFGHTNFPYWHLEFSDENEWFFEKVRESIDMVNMKFFNGLIAFVFIGIPAILWWADVWATGTTPQTKFNEVTENLELNALLDDVRVHEDLMEAYNTKKISRSEYIREMKKLQRKLEKEASSAEKDFSKTLK